MITSEYDISSGKWTKLPPYELHYFAMTVVNNHLVLVGGWGPHGSSKVLGVWRAESTEWTHPYPEMPTERSSSSAVVYNKWLVVAGGYGIDMGMLSTVEVMNTDNKQWFAGPPTPIPWMGMKTAIVEDTCYFMGGAYGNTSEIYHTSLPALISRLFSTKKDQIWKIIPKSPNALSTPLSIGGYLLSVGGVDTSIHLYQPDTRNWVKVGDLPTPRDNCTCAMITDKEIIVAGGGTKMDKYNVSDIMHLSLF